MKWISDTHDCPCLMKTDMEKSGNVYDFLRVYYEEIDSEEDWKDLSFSNLAIVCYVRLWNLPGQMKKNTGKKRLLN